MSYLKKATPSIVFTAISTKRRWVIDMRDDKYHLKRRIKSDPVITCIGGGTGIATMLRGLKVRTSNINAIITVADDGGGSGTLRTELGMLPPGDIRNCIQALSNAEPAVKDLLSYRFDSGRLEGQSFGNLFLAAMNGIYDSFEEAVARMCEVLNITGRVLPVTDEDIHLVAELEDGSEIVGESKIHIRRTDGRSPIKRVSLHPERPRALETSVQAIMQSDLIVFGPGSLYTSIIPNLLVDGVVDAVMQSDAVKIYVCNIMSEPGETDGYNVSQYVSALFDHAGEHIFDSVIVNNELIEFELLEKYKNEGATPVMLDKPQVERLGVTAVCAPMLVQFGGLIRHDPGLLADEIMNIYINSSPTRVYDR